ncbi:RNA methyltransferase [Pseudohoeflea suaedae]|uniref:RNA methyltransferase n=1 Tax=Pseudohoeflea suaedae TaxID=877384 RepID=A0A4V3A6Z3_9HYPH|nr:RNA methyltransferase [Pseudohoeflea suaedae]
MIPIRISDPDDPRIAEFVSLKEKDIAGRGDRFIAEGKVVLNALLSLGATERFSVEKLLVLENRLEGAGEIIDKLDAGIPVYVADRAVMDAITGFAMHRGVLALGRHAPPPDLAGFLDRLPGNALVVACCGISNHDNMGAIFRNAGVFGADGVVIDETCCAPLYRKAIRVSVGAALRVPFCKGGEASDILAALDKAGFATIALSPGGKTDIADIRPAGRTALVVGAEGPGLPADILARTTTVRIPQAPGMDSLNVATATGLALWQVARAMGRLS